MRGDEQANEAVEHRQFRPDSQRPEAAEAWPMKLRNRHLAASDERRDAGEEADWISTHK